MGNSIFETLNNINVNDHTEKKNGLTYLSWAWAWAEVKKKYPNSNYKIYETETGCFYFTDGRTAWVKTGVIIEGLEHIEYLPVMDYKNKSIPVDQITSFDVNKAIQRSLTKAVARHGLGLYIYAGEDLPEDDNKEKSKKSVAKTNSNNTVVSKPLGEVTVNADQMGVIKLEMIRTGVEEKTLTDYFKVKSLNELTETQAKICINKLKNSSTKDTSSNGI